MPISISRILFSPYGGAFQFGHYIELPSLASKSKRGKLKSSMVCDQTLDSQTIASSRRGGKILPKRMLVSWEKQSAVLHCHFSKNYIKFGTVINGFVF
ncbi:hypothetical protein SORBI_3007G147400 [Sorghum bicolor]|uniref:Uncharacterized protein n=1 Tax=Sorghum bicolor TaxID=4558 RepID=A0A1B6PHV5_SORBI|nr:hypothetical protein SORBI_3007G147400 [Sorghum bicolor]